MVYIYNIPSKTFPKDVYKIEPLDVTIFKGDNCPDKFIQLDYYLCIAIKNGTKESRDKIIKDIIISLNILTGRDYSYLWLTQNKINEVIEIDSEHLEEFIQKYKDPKPTFMYDFDNFPFLNPIWGSTYNLRDIILKLHLINEKDELYQKLAFLSVMHPIQSAVNRIYHNAKLEPSLLFILFESIIREEDPDNPNLYSKCDCCKKEVRRGMTQKIKDFFSKIHLSEKEQELCLKHKSDPEVLKNSTQDVAIKLAKVRHSFFHSKDEKTSEEYRIKILNKIFPEKKIITLKDDLNYGDGTFIGKDILTSFLVHFLLNKLLKL